MTSPPATHGRACPHCGKPAGIRWTALLPSNARDRSFACKACGGRYDVSDVCKMASIFGGLLGLGPGIYLFGQLARGRGGSALTAIVGTAAVVLLFGIGSLGLAWVTLRLVPKP